MKKYVMALGMVAMAFGLCSCGGTTTDYKGVLIESEGGKTRKIESESKTVVKPSADAIRFEYLK
jgi:hypothetical protein